jgi:hypothetical protein
MYKSIPATKPRVNATRPKSLMAHFMIRGTSAKPETSAISLCSDVTDVIAEGAKAFPSFHDRNPWIFTDSRHGTVYILLDPEGWTPDLSLRRLTQDARARQVSQ